MSLKLSDVEKTAILTLIYRAVESEKKNPIFKDHMAVLLLERLMAKASEEEKNWILKWIQYSRIYSGDRKPSIQRAKKLDCIVNHFILTHSSCTVINLGCGFDTRFWRIENTKCSFIDLDLPEVIELKKEILESHYELISCSVMDTSWIDKVTTNGNSNFLLIAEGLFIYLSEQDVARILSAISQKFICSKIAFDMVCEKYTKGFRKRIVDWKFKTFMGLDVSVAFAKEPEDIEYYANGLEVIEIKNVSGGSIVTLSINGA
jgi:O-methyltransferase involved in polyketide biosynthesis